MTLPNIKIVDCQEAGLSGKTCLRIRFEHGPGDILIEYAALKEDEPGIESILSGPLFTSELVELENSRVSVTLLEEGMDAQVFIHIYEISTKVENNLLIKLLISSKY